MVIDVRIRPPLPESYQDIKELHQYDHLYRKSSVLNAPGYTMGWDALLSEMDEAGVTKAVLIAEDYEGTLGKKVPNEIVAEGVKRYPDRFLGMASVDPHKGKKAIEELEYAVSELGMIGLGLWPCFHKMYPNHESYYPLYEKCAALDIFIALPVGINFGSDSLLDIGRPIYLDEVAMKFPNLRIVACHGGWPWVLEMIAVAWRRPNIFIDISAVRPKYIAREHSGWGPLINYGNSILQDRIMFSCAWPLLPFKRTIDEVRALPLKNTVVEKWLYKNAVEFLKL